MNLVTSVCKTNKRELIYRRNTTLLRTGRFIENTLMKQARRRALIFTSFVALIGCKAHAQEFFREFGTSRSSGGFGRLSPAAEVFTGNNPDGLSPIAPVEENSESDDIYNF